MSTCPLGTVAYIDWVPPTAPTLTVDDNRHQEILITWTQSTDNVSGVDDYVLQGRAPAGSWATLTTVPAGNPRTFTHTGPAWNQTWDYRIIVSDNAGNTTTSATDTGTFADLVPPEDDGLTLTAIDSGFRIDLVFATLEDDGTSEYSGVDDHAYRWRHNSTGTFSSGGWNSWTTTGSTTINATSGIVYDDYYEVQIRVRDNAGNANYTSSIVHANVDTTPPSITVTQPALDEQENGILNLAAVATDSYAGIDSTGVQFSYRCALCQDGLGWNAYRSIANDPTPNASDVFAHNMRIAAPDDDWGVKDGHIRYRDYPTFYIPNTYADIRGSVCDAAGNCASDVGGDFYTANTAGSRIGGANRDETSALISSTLFPNGAPIAFIARSDVAADALAAAPVAAQMGGPVLLTDGGDGLLDPGSLNSSVANELSRLEGLNPGMRVAMVGGPTALKNSIRDEVESICNCNLVDYTDGDIDTPGGPFGSIPTNPRFNGQNRYYTNAMLAQMAWETGAYAIAANRAGVLVNGEWDQHKLLAGVLAAQGEFGMYFLTRCDGDSDQCPAPQAGDGSGRYNDPTRHGMPWVVHNWIDSTLWGSFFTDGYVLGNTNFVNAATQTLFETWVSSVSTRYPANEANLPSVAANSVSRELFSYSSVEAPGTPNERVTTVYLTRDDNFADALAGAPGIVADNATLLVTDNGTVSTPTCERLKEIAPRRVIALGGQLAISDSALNAAVDDARNWNNPSHTC